MVNINLTYHESVYNNVDTPSIVLHAYEASKEKEQQLQTELHSVKQISRRKDLQISMLEEELQAQQKNVISLRDQLDEHKRELEMLQQRGK